MGVGKTTIGTALAAALDRPLVDTDPEIEERTGRAGREIARADGVSALHALERAIVTEALEGSKPVVVAAAASVVDTAALRSVLVRHTCVWLHADRGIVAGRRSSGDHRRRVSRTEADALDARDTHYAALASLAIDTGVTSAADAVALILELAASRDHRSSASERPIA